MYNNIYKYINAQHFFIIGLNQSPGEREKAILIFFLLVTIIYNITYIIYVMIYQLRVLAAWQVWVVHDVNRVMCLPGTLFGPFVLHNILRYWLCVLFDQPCLVTHHESPTFPLFLGPDSIQVCC